MSAHTALPVLAGTHCRLRELRPGDAPALQRHADDREVWFNLFDGFPHPYSLADAQAWCGGGWRAMGDVFGIEAGGEVAGCIGASALALPGRDCNAEVGWWLGRALWGRGIAAEALALLTPWLWDERPQYTRLQATIYARNTRSQRVAEKAGWVRESVQPRSIRKAGEVIDAVCYAAYRPPNRP